MKDNEKVILIVLGIIAVILLPYFLYSKDAKVDTENLKVQITELQAEYDHLIEMDANRDFWLAETDRYNEEIATIVKKFPADVDNANTTLFLLDAEYSCPLPEDLLDYQLVKGFGIFPATVGVAPEGAENASRDGDTIVVAGYPSVPNGLLYRANVPIAFKNVAFGDNVERPIASEGIDTGMFAVTNSTVIAYETNYYGFKHMLKYFTQDGNPDKNPMTYSVFNATFDEETGKITGEFTLRQFAIIDENDENRKLADRNWTVEEDWDVDVDTTAGHGNEEDGIFGPMKITYTPEEMAAVLQYLEGNLDEAANINVTAQDDEETAEEDNAAEE